MNKIVFPAALKLGDPADLPAAGKPIGNLQAALLRLRLDVKPSDLKRKEMGASTVEAVKSFQEKAGLAADGQVTAETVTRLNAQLAHDFVARSKPRTERLQGLLQQAGHAVDPGELKARQFGPSTEAALKAAQAKLGLPQDGRVTEGVVGRLREDALAARLGAKTQVGKLHRTLLRALNIAKLGDVRVDAGEIRGRKIGPSTQAAIRALQTKYSLQPTGVLDADTFDRLTALAASVPEPMRQLKARGATDLKPLKKPARLNMTSDHVADVQTTLAFLGYKVNEAEFRNRTFGKSTRAAVVSFQQAQGLPVTGHVEGATLETLNQQIQRVNPQTVADTFPYRIRGSVRDELWRGMAGVTIQIRERLVGGQGPNLAERPAGPNGFFDIIYDPPRDPATRQVKQPYSLEIKALDSGGNEIGVRTLFNPTQIAWANFTKGDRPYRGTSEFAARSNAVAKATGNAQVAQLVETAADRQISRAALAAGLTDEDVIRLVLSHLVGAELNRPPLGPEACYAFIGQNLPSTLPGDLIDATEDWTLIENLVDLTANGLVFMEDSLAALAFDNAAELNLVPIAVIRRKDAILAALGALKQDYVFEKPILVGNGSLKGLLGASAVGQAHFPAVADAFLAHKSFGPEFWADVDKRPADFGGADAVADLRTTVEVGHVTKNFTPMLSALKAKIADQNDDSVSSARDLAKLTHDEWAAIIKTNGGQVPPNTDGESAADKIQTYAATLQNQSERMFPDVALAATVARSAANPLQNIQGVQAMMDAHPEFSLRDGNLDVFVAQQNIVLDEATLAEARVLQRVHRLSPTAVAGQALLDNRIHNSSQIVAMGKSRFVDLLSKDSGIDPRIARSIYGYAEHQYAQVLQRIADYRLDLHRANPRAIVPHTYAPAELPPELAAIPDLETLLGSLDFCACDHCQSVYGPAAYLADMLRFLDQHPAEAAGKTVRDMLFERRPDIGNIKLNCPNTDTPLPYVDLVCEVLENAVAAPAPAPDFSFQTTRKAKELRAAPEHVRLAAYARLKSADFPLSVGFDLSQEQTRTFLRHLGVPRWELMEAFQRPEQAGPPAVAADPADASIAGEYWGISSHETGLITATDRADDASQKTFWGFDGGAALPAETSVADFLRRSFLSYDDLLELLHARWINPEGDANNVVIERPNGTCDTELQKVVNLTAARLDRIHRFLRLRRHVGWTTWEIDLLIRAPAIGNGTLDARCLARMMQLARMQKRLSLSLDRALVLFGDINAERRVLPDRPAQAIPPLYDDLFRNPAVINPVDAAFDLPIAAGTNIADADPNLDHRRTIIAAFALTAEDLARLLGKLPDNGLSLSNLSTIGRRAWLARGLGMTVKDLLTLESLSGTDIFASPKAVLDFIDSAEWVTRSPLSVEELAYLLTVSPDSPSGLRDEAVTQHVEALRQAVSADTTGNTAGAIAGQIATAFELAPDQAKLLLEKGVTGGRTLVQILGDPALVARGTDGKFTKAATKGDFPDAHAAFRLLHKAALVVRRFRLDALNLAWLLNHAEGFELLQPVSLPDAAAPAGPLFPAWLHLARWVHFKKLYPEPENASLRRLFDLAGVPATLIGDIKAEIVKLTQWTAAEVDQLATALSLQHGAASDFTDIRTFLRMDRCARMARRMGVSPARAAAWVGRDIAANQALTAQETRQAAKSKYDDAVWLDIVTPLEDALREKKRDALIGYLVANSLATVDPEIVQGGKRFANPAYWRDADDLLKYFLIDVEMSSCQLTSRIKQAISSVQMFVQRCLLGLEQPRVEVSRAQQQDSVSDNSWRQWTWMKNYRVWEANRKIFLYPENWIEPELRDDKSPFFEELESELLQSDMTDEAAGQAFLHYVQKVHEVARLDIVGTYYELDDTDPRDNLPPDINRLHVVGRTRSQPAVYYYRRFDLNYGEWSAWRKVDLDIQSDQVIPVVYNRQLYLFWLNIMEKPQKIKKVPPAKPSESPGNPPESPSQLELQLCWSAQTEEGWTSKKVSQQKLIHPWQRPVSSYNLKPRYKSRENLLWLDVYISQSQGFNSTRFWDAYRTTRDYVTARHPFDETARPWHSSSFIFDGEVVGVKMKALVGQYHILNAEGIANEHLSDTNSVTYVRDNFGDSSRSVGALSGPYEIAPRLPLPDGMRYRDTRLTNGSRNASRANVLENTHSRTLLNGARSPFEIVASQHSIVFDTAAWGPVPFFYQDNTRAFFIRPEWQQVMGGYNQTLQSYNYNYFPFYHPYTALFMRELKRSGVEGLLNRQLQSAPQTYYPGNGFDFASYQPGAMSLPDKTAQTDRVDFEQYGAYALYNWEIFFHAPLMIACRLCQNQRFDEAMRWFHYIFDPTNTDTPDVPQRYWITRPFFEQNSDEYRKQRIDNLLKNIEQHEGELRAWKNDPFKPHLVARYRPVAYQKTVVMKYIDNLIAWGDQLFRRDTIEAINEATTLYVLAHELLGRRPVKVPNIERSDKSYNELTADGALDPFGNKQVEILMENFTGTPVRVTRTRSGSEPLPTLNVSYFGIPNNDRLLGYWDTVTDRLFKIRHCMNIQGVVRQLPLFEPPIDPALLVKAAAAGIDLSSVLADGAVPAAPYRFPHLVQKAVEFCAEVRALGEKLLAALEKGDGEGLSLLRSSHELALLKAVREIRKQQISLENETWASLERSRELTEKKKAFYEGRDFMNPWEITAMSLSGASALIQGSLAVGYVLAGALAFIPKITGGVSGFGATPVVTVDPIDGKNFAEGAGHAMNALEAIMSTLDRTGALASTLGEYWRRKDDWDFQADLATTEIAQIDRQIAAAQIRLAIAEKELENHELQIDQSQALDDYMRGKYTNRQLFDWQARQISTLYFQSYELAYEMAKRAEKSFQHELGDPAASFIQFGHWDSLKKGLLAGERLANDIRRMEAAYLEQDTRDLEITKHVSLAQYFPLELVKLKDAGACTVTLPEWLFDMDYPGHFFRRIKAVSVSIPSVVGPYTGISCTLSLVNHGTRISDSAAAPYGDPLVPGDTRFAKSVVPQTVIATSHGQEDAGMFELNFGDARYLPFEGAGAVSEWRLELPAENNQFDLGSVSDVILHLCYTARSGAPGLAQTAKTNLASILPARGIRLFVLDHEFATEWHRFLNPEAGQDQSLSFELGEQHLPFYARGRKGVALSHVDLIVDGARDANGAGLDYVVELTPPGGPAVPDLDLKPSGTYGGRQSLSRGGFAQQAALLGKWTIRIRRKDAADFTSLPADDIANVCLVIGFKR
ncbi:Tc toxin subunit A-related protein [Paracoccus rhizosphaerae]|uniref:Neuraminidase-like domain-containing protein n=1 Tax=Paracoccus rhizosphaerae TaxID=1133347 RepID=A0ABV6CIY1_9RHOB|nr:neuraminidase-like domain-containing protein [Paracoccus rhizosphaerae]